jgi:hypothetical protein
MRAMSRHPTARMPVTSARTLVTGRSSWTPIDETGMPGGAEVMRTPARADDTRTTVTATSHGADRAYVRFTPSPNPL